RTGCTTGVHGSLAYPSCPRQKFPRPSAKSSNWEPSIGSPPTSTTSAGGSLEVLAHHSSPLPGRGRGDMGTNPEPLRPPVKWHGGKFYLYQRIVQHFSQHHTYVEPFGGAASVLLNKPRTPVEVYNDLDERITRLFRVLRDHGQEFHRRITLTPYS